MTAVMSLPAAAVVKAEDKNRPLGLGPRQRLDRHIGHGGERSPRAGEQFA